MSAVDVDPLKGFRDFGPAEQAARQWLIDCALETCRAFGYFPIETPALERNEILNGQYGEEGDTLRYRFVDHGKRSVGLRYDLTVPFARYVARFLPSSKITLPFRRSQVAPVWRAENTQTGRYREFYQCDFDIAGSSEAAADAEVLCVAHRLLSRLGFGFRIRVNHRGVLDALLRSAGVPSDRARHALISLDKMEKISEEGVRAALTEGEQLSPECADALLRMVTAPLSLTELADKLDDEGKTAIANLRAILDMANAALGEADAITHDLTIVRGLSYYTGMVLETSVVGAEKMGSVLSGGRYDNTIGTFLGRTVPAVGASLGVDRCLTVLESLDLLPKGGSLVDVAVLAFSESMADGFVLANRLRQRGLSVVTYPEKKKKLQMGLMLGYATGVARFAVLVGSQEVAAGRFKLKNLAKHEETSATVDEIIALVEQEAHQIV